MNNDYMCLHVSASKCAVIFAFDAFCFKISEVTVWCLLTQWHSSIPRNQQSHMWIWWVYYRIGNHSLVDISNVTKNSIWSKILIGYMNSAISKVNILGSVFSIKCCKWSQCDSLTFIWFTGSRILALGEIAKDQIYPLKYPFISKFRIWTVT